MEALKAAAVALPTYSYILRKYNFSWEPPHGCVIYLGVGVFTYNVVAFINLHLRKELSRAEYVGTELESQLACRHCMLSRKAHFSAVGTPTNLWCMGLMLCSFWWMQLWRASVQTNISRLSTPHLGLIPLWFTDASIRRLCERTINEATNLWERLYTYF